MRRLPLAILALLAVDAAASMTRLEALKELQLPTSFDEKQLKAAYRARSLATHPDKGGSAAAFLRVSEAYELLKLGGAGGAGAGGPRGAGGARGAGGGMSQEEAFRRAEAMFSSVLEEFLAPFLDADTRKARVNGWVDGWFGEVSKFNPLKYALRGLARGTANLVAGSLADVAENGLGDDFLAGATINVNGVAYSGADVRQLLERMRERARGAARSEL